LPDWRRSSWWQPCCRARACEACSRACWLDPLRHPVNFHFGFTRQPMAWAVLGAAVILTVLWRWRPSVRAQIADTTAGLRLLALAGFVWHARTWLTIHGVGHFISYVLP